MFWGEYNLIQAQKSFVSGPIAIIYFSLELSPTWVPKETLYIACKQQKDGKRLSSL